MCSTFGAVVGRDAALDALAYSWENWQRVAAMDNPVGYLYRVGITAGRRATRRLPRFQVTAVADHELLIEPKLDGALRQLSPQQRVAVVLVHGYGYSLQEVADVLGLKRTSVQNHVERAMARLRTSIASHRRVERADHRNVHGRNQFTVADQTMAPHLSAPRLAHHRGDREHQ